ncbi:MAG: hypothetical protein OIF34_10305, partial [Porticoccaceae bacterium]|nr:hypothetical protein [Porticoccaceae bacterium]
GSGLWVWGAKRVLIEKSAFLNANGPGDSAGVHIDYNCTDVIVQHNLSANNAGGFYEVLGNNYNTAYRYNLSINDGHRVKGENGAFQEGKTFWLSGFQGNRKRKGPFNSYFYNNTIYVDDSIVSKVAVDRAADGVLVANNIFYIKGKSQRVLGDQYSPEKTGKSAVQDVLFKNNLFLRADSWPEDVFIRDSAPLYGDPLFAKPGGMHVSDYLPTAKALVKDRGIAIENIPGDRRGLFLGLKVEQDILGNPVTGKPDMGAIELHK